MTDDIIWYRLWLIKMIDMQQTKNWYKPKNMIEEDDIWTVTQMTDVRRQVIHDI